MHWIHKKLLTLLKITVVAWTLHNGSQYMTERAIMASVYPAQSSYYKRCRKQCDKMRAGLEAAAQFSTNCHIHPIILEDEGLQFHGWMICDPALQDKKQWVLQAVGNNTTVEEFIPAVNERYIKAGFNTLLINNPGVGGSQGTSTPKTMGKVQSLALTYLEETVQAKKIVLAGHSLGGASIGQAILQHTFKPDVQYLVIQQMTFGRLSHTAKIMKPILKLLASPLIHWTELEMDTVAASQKLANLGIEEWVINKKDRNGFAHDGVIPGEATLGAVLHKIGLLERKKAFHPNISLDFSHNSKKFLQLTAQIIQEWGESKDLQETHLSY